MVLGNRFVFMDQAGDGGAAGGGGQQAGGQQAGGQQQGQQAGGQAPPVFADAAAARGFLKDWADPTVLATVKDEQVVPWATSLKTRVDEFGKQIPGSWREIVAGGNAEHLKTLERFATPKALYDAYGALRQKMSSGELRPVTPFPEKGTPEEQSAWRTTNGVPEKADAYKIELPKEIQLDDDDKGIVKTMTEAMHGFHAPQDFANRMVNWFFTERENRIQKAVEADLKFRAQNEDILRQEWGNDYRPNQGRIVAMLDTMPGGLKEKFASARFADGSRIANDADFNRFMIGVARQIIPAGVVIPGDGNVAESISAELKKIDDFRGANRDAYFKDEKMQGRYRELLDGYQKTTGKEWGKP